MNSQKAGALLISALCAALSLAACGSDDASTPTRAETASSESSSSPEPASNAVTAESRPPESSGNSTSGRFEATPGNGYTVEVSYDLSNIEGQINIAEAEPGQAIVYGSASGEMTITNTTPQRNTEVKLPQLEAELLWSKSQIAGELLPNLTEPDGVCEFSFRGASYCNLANLYFEFASEEDYFYGDPTTIRPNQALSMATTAPENAPARPGPYGSLVVREGYADKLSRFVNSTPPDLLAIYGGTGGLDELRMSCATDVLNANTRPEASNGPLAILNGKGQPLIEGGGVERYESYPLMCADA